MRNKTVYKAIVIGTSAGGLTALSSLLKVLPADYPFPIIIVQHRIKDQRCLLEEVLQYQCALTIKQADEKEAIKNGVVYIAPPDYHLLIEEDRTFSLSVDEHVLFSRPAIDVLFESAAIVFREQLVGILLTGASRDGAQGMSTIKEYGGKTIVQQPEEADFPFMPEAAIKTGMIDQVCTLLEMQHFLLNLRAA